MAHVQMGEGKMNPNREAEAQYRVAWDKYRNTWDDAERIPLEKEMNRLQPLIAVGPWDTRWVEFIETLDGYKEFWGFAKDQMIKKIKNHLQ
jgi:hypothetical protein